MPNHRITYQTRRFNMFDEIMKIAQFFCPIRKIQVKKTPEECVRQKVLFLLIQELGYPYSLIAVEKKLSELPPIALSPKRMPNRRIDIVCYAAKATFEPLLLIECKANGYDAKELRQLLGYNYYIGAPYIALVNDQKTTFLSTIAQQVQDTIPPYRLLLDQLLLA